MDPFETIILFVRNSAVADSGRLAPLNMTEARVYRQPQVFTTMFRCFLSITLLLSS